MLPVSWLNTQANKQPVFLQETSCIRQVKAALQVDAEAVFLITVHELYQQVGIYQL